MVGCLNHLSKMSFFEWNINGLLSKSFLGNKLQSADFVVMINNFDFIMLSETWKEIDIEVSGYRSIVQAPSKVGKSGRNSGGLALLYNTILLLLLSIQYGVRLIEVLNN